MRFFFAASFIALALVVSATTITHVVHANAFDTVTGTVSAQSTTGGVNTGGGTTVGGVNTGGSPVTLINPLKGVDCSSANGDCLMAFLQNILSFVVRIGTIAIILMLVFVGYKFVVAQGAPGAIEEAKKMLLWTVVGALVLLGAQAIALAIQATVSALGG